jgi:hypothetical protein
MPETHRPRAHQAPNGLSERGQGDTDATDTHPPTEMILLQGKHLSDTQGPGEVT